MTCVNLDRDQTFTVHDFGPRGHVGTVTVNLTHGLEPGAMLGMVVLSDQEFYINVYDGNKNSLVHLAARVTKNQVVFNSLLGGKWGADEVPPKHLIVKGIRASVSFLYESEGYRIFINGESMPFYKHRSEARPNHLEISNAQVYKIIYHTTMNIIP